MYATGIDGYLHACTSTEYQVSLWGGGKWPGMSVRGGKNVLIKSGIPCELLSTGCAFVDSSLLGLAVKSPWLEVGMLFLLFKCKWI